MLMGMTMTMQVRMIRIRIRMIYSFRPLPLMKGCRWMTYYLKGHTIITPISKYNYYNNKDDNDGEEVDDEGNTDLHRRW